MTLAGINKAHQGAERMRSELNRYFGEMINYIVDAGGDVVKFAGDALMAVWRLDDDFDGELSERSVAEAAKLRAVCMMCMEMTANLDGWIVEGLASYKATGGSVEKTHHQLHLHTAVTVGRIESYVVGGFNGGQWLQTLAGPPISQITDCIDQAKQSEVVISGECAAVLRRGETARIQEKDSAGGVTAGKTPGKSGDVDSLLDILDSELDEGAHCLMPFGEFDTLRKTRENAKGVSSAFRAPSFNLLAKQAELKKSQFSSII